MQLLRKKKRTRFVEKSVEKLSVISHRDRQAGSEFLVSFFSDIRPGYEPGFRNAETNLDKVIDALKKHPILLKNLQLAFLSQFINTDLTAALTESGIPLARGFWQELGSRLRHKVLPVLQDERDFLYVVNRVFFRHNDYMWVEDIPREKWITFFESLGLSFRISDTAILQQLLQSLKVLAFQIAQLGLEKELLHNMSETERKSNPFIEQNYLVHDLEKCIQQDCDNEKVIFLSKRIEQVIEQCYRIIENVREQHAARGTSLNQTYIIILLLHRLQRMSILLDVLDSDHEFNTGRLVDVFRMLVRNENRKNSIREFLSQGLGYLAYQIAEHKGHKGGKYITSTRKEYWSMIRSAMKGGAIICFVAIFKNLLGKLHFAPFWQGFLYSINYSAGFVMIEETGATLATKQPAFTASAVASSLDTKKTQQPNLYNLAITVAKVSRSQVASFFGNLVIVFPGTYLLAWLYDVCFGYKIVSGEAALKLLTDQHPWQSASLLYACFAGFFLFLSGIIAGYVQNKIQYSHIRERLQYHPLLRMSFSENRLKRISNYIESHGGALIGNIALGFFLGMASITGKIFGIPFDIRHITISAGNTAIGVYGAGIQNIPPLYLLTVFLGVLGIGFMNFFVSFLLAFIVAVRSRNIHLREYPEFLQILWRYFRQYPLSFIRANKRSVAED